MEVTFSWLRWPPPIELYAPHCILHSYYSHETIRMLLILLASLCFTLQNASRQDESPNNDPETNITRTLVMVQDHACQLVSLTF